MGGRWSVATALRLGSNSGMTAPDTHTEQRLTNLEIKASYTDDLLETLNDIVTRQQDLIDQLRREVRLLRQLHQDPTNPTAPNGLDDRPPHY